MTEQCIDSYRTFQQTQYRNKQEKQSMLKTKSDEEDSEEEESEDEEEDMDNNQLNLDTTSSKIDPRKINIVEQVFDHCYQTGNFKQAIGIAIECRRVDRVQQAIELSGI